MSLLLNCAQSLSCRGERFTHPRRRCPTRHVVNREYVFQFHKLKKVLLKMRVNLFQFFDREAFQFATLIECQPNGLPHLLMCDPEWNTFTYKIGSRGKSVHITSLGCSLHALEIELHRLHPSRYQRQQ